MHISVLQKEVLEYLNPKEDENFIDCTAGELGHTLAILEKNGPKGKVLAIDRDLAVVNNLKLKVKSLNLKNRVIVACGNFVNLKEIVEKEKFKNISGILFDLGLSSWDLEESGRGFSFLKNEPLDMRYDPESQLTAEKILNYWPESEIESILREFGEERFSGNIAKEILKERKLHPIQNTFQLVGIIKKSLPQRYQYSRLHFATRTFQALRIAVNDELKSLETALPQAIDLLRPSGRIAVISFHSLEDRFIKVFFKEKKGEGVIKILTKKPIGPKQEEIINNPRSRSGRMRAAEKI